MSEEEAIKNLEELLKYKNDKEIHTNNLFECIEIILKENKELKERTNETLKLINEIQNLEYDKFCSYHLYLESLNDIYLTLKGDK